MITVRKSDERGFFDHGWLRTFHSFSFADYYDPAHMGFKSLRVINQDVVEPHEGFGTHPHKDMEIITYVLKGELSHKDSTGHESTIRAGNVQIMSAGKGVMHSEFNNSAAPVEILQIWIVPTDKGLSPRYAEKTIKISKNKLVPIAESYDIYQDAKIHVCKLERSKKILYDVSSGRGIWIQLITGELDVSGAILEPGDGAAIEDEEDVEIIANKDAHFLLFDVV